MFPPFNLSIVFHLFKNIYNTYKMIKIGIFWKLGFLLLLFECIKYIEFFK